MLHNFTKNYRKFGYQHISNIIIKSLIIFKQKNLKLIGIKFIKLSINEVCK